MQNASVKRDLKDYERLGWLLNFGWIFLSWNICFLKGSQNVEYFSTLIALAISGGLFYLSGRAKIASLLFSGTTSSLLAYFLVEPSLAKILFVLLGFCISSYSAARFAAEYELPMPEVRLVYIKQFVINFTLVLLTIGFHALFHFLEPGLLILGFYI